MCLQFVILSYSYWLLSPIFLWLSWGLPLGITVAALCLHKIGYDASEVSVGWCWVSIQAKDHVLWMLLTGKIWEFLAYVMLPVLYLLIKCHIHRAVSRMAWSVGYQCCLFDSKKKSSWNRVADSCRFCKTVFTHSLPCKGFNKTEIGLHKAKCLNNPQDTSSLECALHPLFYYMYSRCCNMQSNV